VIGLLEVDALHGRSKIRQVCATIQQRKAFIQLTFCPSLFV
jgi:hypothetical protein